MLSGRIFGPHIKVWRNSCFSNRPDGKNEEAKDDFLNQQKVPSRKIHMTDFINDNMTWIGLGFGIILLFGVLEMLLRTLTNRYGTPQAQ